jgi:hypothetical protein
MDLFPMRKNTYSIMVREIARFQQGMDSQFELQLLELRSKLFLKKITPKKFWEEYKKLLLKSIAKNESKIKKILKNADKEMNLSFKEAEKEPIEEKPKIDLSLPK